MSFWHEKEGKRLFQELPLYNVLIEKPRIKRVKNIYLLPFTPFYGEFSIVKISGAFKRYTRSYKIEIIDAKDPLTQLETSKSRVEDFFKDLLDEMRGFKYQITVKVLLRKHKNYGHMKFVLVYFNSTTTTLVNLEYDLDKSFQ